MRHMTSILLFLLIVTSFAGCAGKKVDRRSDGTDQAESTRITLRQDPSNSTTAKEASPHIKIQGRLFMEGGILPLPLRFQRIALYSGAKEKKEVMTDAEGQFVLSGLFASGDYRIVLKSADYRAETSVKINRENVDSIVLRATPKIQ